MKGRFNSRSDLRNTREEEQDKKEYNIIRNLLALMIVLCIATLLLFSMSSCTTTKYVEVPVVHTDTVYKSKVERDSIWLHDSVEVKVKGDSTIIEKWHTKYKETFVHDTLYQAKTDSIPVPYPVEKLVEKNLTWWQKARLYIADVGLMAIGLWIIIFIIKKRRLIGLTYSHP